MTKRRCLFAVAALAAAVARADAPLESVAARAGKGALVLQTGSDWCVSGEDVRKVFESAAFKKAVGAKFVLAVRDERETRDEATDRKNALCDALTVPTKRYPAITCTTPTRFFAQLENVPRNVTAEKLASAILSLAKKKDEAEALFKKGASLRGKDDKAAADAYGAGFDILCGQVGDFNADRVRHGDLAYSQEWDALASLDAGDRYGWLRHFEMDDYKTVAMVEKVTELKASGSGQAAAFVEDLKRVPKDHFTVNQKQCVKIMEYALTANGTDKPLTAPEKKLLREAFDMGRDTLWGQFAMGRLIMDGEKIESKGLKKAAVRERPASNAGIAPAFALDSARNALTGVKPGAKLNEAQALAAAKYAALRLIGQRGWGELASRPGSSQFAKAFLADRVWMEDFAWSGTFPANSSDAWAEAGNGPGAGAAAILALESLVYQDNGRWCKFADGKYEDNEGRRFMTALALNYPDKDEAWLADVLDAYRSCALAGRLHKSAYAQPVWLWRFALHQGHATASTDDMAAQQRHLNKFVNLPCRDYGGTCWMIVYRLKNCFGDSVHGPYYYKAWERAGEWPKRRYSQIVGGVCGELSKFGSATANAHGLPSTTVGQPGHCAYSRRLPGGKWEVNYSVTGHSQMHLCFWNKHPWQYSTALESTYGGDRAKRLAAERQLALANVAEDTGRDAKTVETYYRHACASLSGHYGAWKAYGDWLMRTKTPLDKLKVWVRGCARGMKTGRQPVWDFLTPYFARVAKEKGAKALVADLVEFAPNLRQSDGKLQEESDFKEALKAWTEPLGKNPDYVVPVLKAFIAAQYGTRDFFSQTLGWGSDLLMGDKATSELYFKTLSEVVKEQAADGKKADLDFSPLILGASQAGNLGAFRQLASLQDALDPAPKGGKAYPASDFGGELVSAAGMLKTSSTSQWDKPGRYARCIDATPAASDGAGAAFHTAREKSPWAEVVLPGPVEVTGVVAVNTTGQNAGRQVPLEILVSEDGASWKSVYKDGAAKAEYRANLRSAPERARYVRVVRTADARDDFFHLAKILVYGKKLY